MMPGFAPQVQGPEFVHPDDAAEESKAVTTAVFIELEPEKEISMAARSIKEAVEKPAPVKVKVVAPYRVLHEGKPYVGGDVLEVPKDKERDIWLKSGWVELVKEK
jgi:hypothetical protein